jgi:flagellar motor switch protein FliM
VTKHLQSVSVAVSVKLGDTELTLQDLLDLQVGDTITLNQNIRNPLLVSVDDVPTYYGGVGLMKQRYAVKILEECEEVIGDGGQQHETFSS